MKIILSSKYYHQNITHISNNNNSSRISMKMDTRIPNSASFKVLKEDHTLGTILVVVIMLYSFDKYYQYTINYYSIKILSIILSKYTMTKYSYYNNIRKHS